MSAITDAQAMQMAIAEGARGRLSAPPNPWVGCVVVRAGTVVGRGFHLRPGDAHAEVLALTEAGDAAAGATAYVSLEPCAHHGRTPPCADALVTAGVQRVVFALEDPDARVRGAGATALRDAGLEVVAGVEAEAAAESLLPYLHHRMTGRPFVVIKAAASLDGKIAAADRTSQWITGEEARGDGHALRAASQAVVIGSGTALADRPRLTARGGEPGPVAQPLRVLLDATGRVPADGPLFDLGLAPTLVVTTSQAEGSTTRAWKAAGAEVEEVGPGTGGGVDLAATLDLLGRRGVLQALVEGGSTLQGSLVREELADEMVLYTSGVILGDDALPLWTGLAVSSLSGAPRWRLVAVDRIGADLRTVWRRR